MSAEARHLTHEREVGREARNHAEFIWSVADLLRGDFKEGQYGKVILPLTVLRRLDCVLRPTKERVLEKDAALEGRLSEKGPVLQRITGVQFHNASPLDLEKVLDDPPNAADGLRLYVAGFSKEVREVFEKFDLDVQIAKLDAANLLYLVLGRFADIDLGPEAVSNTEMGYVYEELVRRFSELSKETAGEHFTPREVVELMVNLLFVEDDDLLSKPGTVKTILDPACGTGGMLSVAEQYLRGQNPEGRLEVYGQELNAETYAVCRSDMMLKDPKHRARIVHGNSFSQDGHAGTTFDYLIANPPFGVEWKKVRDEVDGEHEKLGFAGRFGAGLPRINDGSFLFLQHMISKMKPVEEGGSRVAIVFNGSPLFTGAAGSGESEIRRWIIENDWLEAVVALPDQLFYNTGISTYFWVVTNRKAPERRGKVQLVDARGAWEKMKKALGEKRKKISDKGIAEIVRLYGDLQENGRVKVLPNESFGAMRITVERPLRLRWEVTDETLAAVASEPKLAKMDEETRASSVSALAERNGLSGTDREALAVDLSPLFARFGLTQAQQNAVWNVLAVRDPEAPVVADKRGKPLPDPELRDHENVPLPGSPVAYEADPTARLRSPEYRAAVREYMEREVLPYLPDAWVDHEKTKIGYEIPLTRHFYVYEPPRPLEEIDAEIKALEKEIQDLLAEVTE
ncbi:MAG: type I restriction-modification system subunit M [Actinomycetota bacterium]|nr:type I restriction-modification system subunit M [Actinomycetota bacterium]